MVTIDGRIGDGATQSDSKIVDNEVYGRIQDLFHDSQGQVKFTDDEMRKIFKDHKEDQEDNIVSREQENLARVMRSGADRYESTMRVAAQLNEALNSNAYIERAMTGEVSRVGSLNQKVREEVSKLTMLNQQDEHDLNYRRFLRNGIMITLLVTAVMGALLGQWLDESPVVQLNNVLFYTLSGGVTAAYAVGMLALFVENSMRRKYQWDKRYWNPDLHKRRKKDANRKKG